VKQSLYVNTLSWYAEPYLILMLEPSDKLGRHDLFSVFAYSELYSGRLVARTLPFQGGEAGSIPVRSTKLWWTYSRGEGLHGPRSPPPICRCSPLGRAPDCLSDLGGFDSRRRRQDYGCVGKLVTPEDCKSSARKALLVRIQRHPPSISKEFLHKEKCVE
jgi:hypothetical protein